MLLGSKLLEECGFVDLAWVQLKLDERLELCDQWRGFSRRIDGPSGIVSLPGNPDKLGGIESGLFVVVRGFFPSFSGGSSQQCISNLLCCGAISTADLATL